MHISIHRVSRLSFILAQQFGYVVISEYGPICLVPIVNLMIGIIHINSTFSSLHSLVNMNTVAFNVRFCCFSYSFAYPHFQYCRGPSLLRVCGSRRISPKSVFFLHPFRFMGVTKLAYMGGGLQKPHPL